MWLCGLREGFLMGWIGCKGVLRCRSCGGEIGGRGGLEEIGWKWGMR